MHGWVCPGEARDEFKRMAEGQVSERGDWLPPAMWGAIRKIPFFRSLRTWELYQYPVDIKKALETTGLCLTTATNLGRVAGICTEVLKSECHPGWVVYNFVAFRIDLEKKGGHLSASLLPFTVNNHVIERYSGRTGRMPEEFFGADLCGAAKLAVAAVVAWNGDGGDLFLPFKGGLLCGRMSTIQSWPSTEAEVGEANLLGAIDPQVVGSSGLEISYGKRPSILFPANPMAAPAASGDFPSTIRAFVTSTWVPFEKLRANQVEFRNRMIAVAKRRSGEISAVYDAMFLDASPASPEGAAERWPGLVADLQKIVARHREMFPALRPADSQKHGQADMMILS
jgi:hypothetical protein